MATIVANALTTLARAKSFLGISTDSKDTQLIMQINHVTAFMERYCKRAFKKATYTNEVYDGTGTKMLTLKNFPVTAFTQLQFNRAANNEADWETVDGNRYFTDLLSGVITLAGTLGTFLDVEAGVFVSAPQKYRATYDAGYLIDFANEANASLHTLPQELEYICLKMVSAGINSARSQGIDSERVGDTSVTYSKQLFGDSEMKSMLDKYVSPTI